MEVEPITRREAEVAFASSDSRTICHALIRIVYHDPDWRWLQNKCIEMSEHLDSDVAGLAVACLGDIARIHRTLDLETVLPALKKRQGNPEIAGRVEDALDDIEIYLHRKVERSTT